MPHLPLSTLLSSWGFSPRPSSIDFASAGNPQAMSSDRQHTCTNSAPYSCEPSLPIGFHHTSSTDGTPSFPHPSRVSASDTHQPGVFLTPLLNIYAGPISNRNLGYTKYKASKRLVGILKSSCTNASKMIFPA